MDIGIIGAGNIGGTVGKLWVQAGHRVRFGVRHPDRISAMVSGLGERASAASSLSAAEFGECVLFAGPYGAWPDFADSCAGALAGKTVIDAANPVASRDGAIVDAIARFGSGAGAYTASLLPRSRIAKAFNTVVWSDLRDDAHRRGVRFALAIAVDDDTASQLVEGLVDDAGFEPVVIGGLSRSGLLDPGGPLFAKPLTAAQLRDTLERVRAPGEAAQQ